MGTFAKVPYSCSTSLPLPVGTILWYNLLKSILGLNLIKLCFFKLMENVNLSHRLRDSYFTLVFGMVSLQRKGMIYCIRAMEINKNMHNSRAKRSENA